MADQQARQLPVAVFGEALLDCFNDGEEEMGGAPFNVAWHLQALGDEPLFISRLGDDVQGHRLKDAMEVWGMALAALQIDPQHATGTVQVNIRNGEPHYDIRDDSAWDYIDANVVPALASPSLLYHGTLALRHAVSRAALQKALRADGIAVFIDLNLREPWWTIDSVLAALQHARWAKLNQHELAALGFQSGDLRNDMAALQQRFALEQLILTCGEAGAIVRCSDGQYVQQASVAPAEFIDSVGAGDAFSAMYIHGLRAGWPLARTLDAAQHFASAVLGQRGAIVQDPQFYQRFRQHPD